MKMPFWVHFGFIWVHGIKHGGDRKSEAHNEPLKTQCFPPMVESTTINQKSEVPMAQLISLRHKNGGDRKSDPT